MQGIKEFTFNPRAVDTGIFGFNIKDEDDVKFYGLCDVVYQCGIQARDNQKKVHRTIKGDGTPLTETDLAVTEKLNEYISNNWPDCCCISEEVQNNVIVENPRYYFVFDPIDGTDCYSQGMPEWCIGVGVLDSNRKPCAAIVFAPKMGVGEQELFVCSAFNDKNVYLNGNTVQPLEHRDEPMHITIGSNAIKTVDFGPYRGKIRSLGSALLHILAPCIWPNTDACLSPSCYVWDICSSHVISTKLGFESSMLDGSSFEYSDSILFDRKPTRDCVVVGNRSCISWIVKNFKRRTI